MAAGILEHDHMMSVRETPWHGIGTILQDVATAQEAIEAARLNWAVEKRPIMHDDNNGTIHASTQYFVTVRSDTNHILGVVGSKYNPLQNVDAFKFLDAVCQDPNGAKYHTAGSLFNGKRVWILAKLPSFIQVTEQDLIEEYLLLANTHDGSRRVETMFTSVRVVCQNTLNMTRASAKSKVRFKHIKDWSEHVTSTQDLLGIARDNHTELDRVFKSLLAIHPTQDQARGVLKDLFTPPSGKDTTSATTNLHDHILHSWMNASTNMLKGIEGTGYSFLNAITEYCDHERPYQPTVHDKADSQVDSIWFGKSADTKARAVDRVLALV